MSEIASGRASARTSINQVPRLHKTLRNIMDTSILDYGCGKFTTAKEYIISKGASYVGYDKYHRPEVDLRHSSFDCTLVSNVLNVLSYPERMELYGELTGLDTKEILFTVYEGDKSGNRNLTKIGTRQNNMRTLEYYSELEQAFELRGVVTLKNNIITVKVL